MASVSSSPRGDARALHGRLEVVDAAQGVVAGGRVDGRLDVLPAAGLRYLEACVSRLALLLLGFVLGPVLFPAGLPRLHELPALGHLGALVHAGVEA